MVYGSWFTVHGLRFMVHGLRFMVYGSGNKGWNTISLTD